MTWSLSEVEAQARKAARGAGYSWGLSEDAGRAVRWLCGYGLPGAAALVALLERPPSSDACPLYQGALICDLGALPDSFPKVMSPLLLLPFLAWTGPVGGLDITIGNAVVQLTDVGQPGAIKGAFPTQGRLLMKAPVTPSDAPIRAVERPVIPEDIAARLNAFAARTYAPDTVASRLKGAGAGTVDRD